MILTARDEKKGLEAVEKLKRENGFSDQAILFHLLDVSNPDSIASLASFVKTRFGKLDVLVLFCNLFVNQISFCLRFISFTCRSKSVATPFPQITLVII